jgi:hypothetical protein
MRRPAQHAPRKFLRSGNRAARVLVALALALAVWAVARPASAAPAPFCDDRGASAIAPPPMIESPTDVLERVRAASSCTSDDGESFRRSFAPMHRLPRPTGPNLEPALPRSCVAIVLPGAGEPVAVVKSERSPDGVRARVERPPRG